MKHCTQCGQEAVGRFCGACGATLRALPCSGCGIELPPGTRFCNACGSPAHAPVRGPTAGEGAGGAGDGGAGGGRLLLGISGGLLAVLVLLVLFLEFRAGDPVPLPAGAPPSGALGPAPNVDLASMTPRQAADALYNRVMNAIAREDDVEARNFLPMAIDAYELARPLDDDGLFHLSLLQRAAGDAEGALATALEALEESPEHLLNLSAAAEASRELGELAAAAAYYRTMLEAWDRELALGRIEYAEHERLLPLLREDAETLLEGDGS